MPIRQTRKYEESGGLAPLQGRILSFSNAENNETTFEAVSWIETAGKA